MDTVYIDASAYPQRAKGELSSSLSLVSSFYLGIIPFTVAAAVGSESPHQALIIGGGLLVSFTIVAMLVARGHRILRPSGLRVAAYGVTVRRIARRLARLRRDLDAATGWSHRRTLLAAYALRLLAILAVAATFFLWVSPDTMGVAKSTAAPLSLGSLLAAFALWIGAQHLLNPQRYQGVLPKILSIRARGIVVFLVALAAAGLALGAGVELIEMLVPRYSENVHALILPTMLVAFLIVRFGYLYYDECRHDAKVIARPATADQRRFDKRRPVLFLRSFPDDTQHVSYEMTGKWEEEAVVPLELALDAQLKRYGPFIAIAEPGRSVLGGAARDHVPADAWRGVVKTWMDEAFLITLIAGWTEGVQWELDQVVRGGYAEKLLVVLPDGPHRDARWRHVCRSFSGTPWHSALIGTDVRAALAVHFDQHGRLIVIASRAKSAGHYQAAVELAIYGMCCQDPAGPTRATRPTD